jgi:hypothetical protein
MGKGARKDVAKACGKTLHPDHNRKCFICQLLAKWSDENVTVFENATLELNNEVCSILDSFVASAQDISFWID